MGSSAASLLCVHRHVCPGYEHNQLSIFTLIRAVSPVARRYDHPAVGAKKIALSGLV